MQYKKLCEVYEQLEKHSKRLDKTKFLSELLQETSKEELKDIVYLSKGRIFPDYDETEIGMSSQLVIKSIAKATGINEESIVHEWKKIGDLGKVAESLINIKKQSTLFSHPLTTNKVIENLRKASKLEGQGTVARKVDLVAELLTSASPLEARYIIRTILGELRIGVAAGTLRDSIIWAFGKVRIEYDEKKDKLEIQDREKYNEILDEVQHAYDVSTDFGIVAENLAKGIKKISDMSLEVGKPIKVMLAPKAEDIKDAFERCGKPCQFEWKYDGFRLQIHKDKNGKVSLFTRRLDNVTKQFPEVVEAVKKHVKGKEFILDSEAVGFNPKTKIFLPFQTVSQRIKRKYDIEKTQKEFPVEVNVFDIIYYEGKTFINEPFEKRSNFLTKIIKDERWKLVKARKLVTSDEKEAEKFYKDALKIGMEGLMVKNLKSEYKPGARVGYMLKLKPSANSFDLVITGAEYGTGKRFGWLSSFTLSCRSEDKFLEIGKVGTGVKEKSGGGVSFEQLTKLLKPLVTEEKGKEIKVKPKIIVEVVYQEIQKSSNYESGYALRFPRVIRLREDKGLDDVESLENIKKYYAKQKFGK